MYFRRDLHCKIDCRSKLYCEYLYKYSRNINIETNEPWNRVFCLFSKFEPQIINKLNENLIIFLNNYKNENYYSNSQRKIILYLLKNLFNKESNWFYISGNAGTGKSFLMRELVKLFEEVLNLNVMVWASTGTAAKNIGGITVHRGFNINTSNFASMTQPGSHSYISLMKKNVIIIDEISMLNADILESIDLIWRQCSKNTESNLDYILPFGGKLVILFGDLLQIPWVQEQQIGIDVRETDPIYKACSFKNFEWLFLKEQMRQAKDYQYSDIWNQVSRVNFTDDCIDWLRARVCKNGQGGVTDNTWLKSLYHDTTINNLDDCDLYSQSEILWVAATNNKRNEVNNIKLRSHFSDNEILIFNAEYFRNGMPMMEFEVTNYMKSIFIQEHTYEETLKIAIGAKVILNVNLNVKEGLTNGTIGIVKGYHDDIIEFEYQFHNKSFIAFITKQSKDYNLPYIHWTRRQFPISLAYCLTMHKCQGQTIDGVVIVWDDIFWPGLFYSILARCRDSKNIYLKNYDVKRHIIADREVINLIQQKDIEFDENFNNNYEKFPDISGCIETYLRMIRDRRISWSVIVDFISANNEFEIIDEIDIYNEGFNWIKILDEFLKMREDFMFDKFYNNNVEGIDWRYGVEVDQQLEGANVIERLFVIRDDSDVDSEQEELINNILNINDQMDVDVNREISRIHNYESDHWIPWVYWIEDLVGFEWLMLIFYKCIYQKFIRDYGLSIFSEYIGDNLYINLLIKFFERMSSIDNMEEYWASDYCRRLNDVFTPFMQAISRNETFETIIEALFYENSPFMFSITCYYNWRNYCYQDEFNKMLTINKQAAYIVINSSEFNSKWKRIWEINGRVIYKSLYENIEETCWKWKWYLKTCRIDVNSSTQFLFIINKQSFTFKEDENKTFTIYRKLKIPINNFESKTKQNRVNPLDIFTYNMKAVIFVDDQGHYSSIQKFTIDRDEQWFKYDGSRDDVYLITETYEPDFIQIYEPSYDNASPWPYIFLYELEF